MTAAWTVYWRTAADKARATGDDLRLEHCLAMLRRRPIYLDGVSRALAVILTTGAEQETR